MRSAFGVWLLALACGGMGIGCVCGQPGRVLETEGIRVVGPDGKVRIELGSVETGASKDATGVRVYDAQGHERILLSVEEEGGASVVLRDKEGFARTWMSASARGDTDITLTDEKGFVRLKILVDVTGSGRLIFRKADGMTDVELPTRNGK